MKTEYPDILNKVIYCISQNKSIGEICSILNINCEDLLKILKLLKKNNYEIDNYHFADDLILDIDSTSLKISLDKCTNTDCFSIGIISDTHIGNNKDCLAAIHAAYNEFLKRNIYTVVHLGDVIEGDHTSLSQRYADSYEQTSLLIHQYPCASEINTILLLGNHDYHCIRYNQTDIKELIESERTDLKVLGYGVGILSIAEDYIYLRHKIPSFISPLFPFNQEGKILLTGHSHSFKVEGYRVRKIRVPSLSQLSNDPKIENPCFLILTFHLNNNKLDYCEIQKMIYKHEDIKTVEVLNLSLVGGAFGCKTQEQLTLKRKKTQNSYLQV